MTPERYIITASPVTPENRLYAAEPLGVRLTVCIAGPLPWVQLMSVTDATEDGAVRQLSAQIVMEFMQGKFRVGPAGLPPGAVHERVLAALIEGRAKRQADRDRATHYLSILNDEIAAMRDEAKLRGFNEVGVSPRPAPGGELAQTPPVALEPPEPVYAAGVAPSPSPAPAPAPVTALPPLARPQPARTAEAQPAPAPRRRDSDITEGLRPLAEPTPPDATAAPAADPAREGLRRRWHAVAHVGVLSSPDGRLMLWAANHAELAIKMAKQDRRWWEIGAVGKPTADFIRDAFDRWVVSREGRRVESYEQGTIDKLWDPYCRFMMGDPLAGPPVAKTAAPAPISEDHAGEGRHHEE